MPPRSSKTSSRNNNTSQSAAERYEVQERQGEGVLFVVYQTRERSSLEPFALKALRHSYARHQPFYAAWMNVANAALNRNIPHIARVHEVGVEESTPYLVEDWLPGHSLEERLRRAPFGRIETATVARHMAQGLHGLHQSGQTHGDFRPRQVLFTPQTDLRITDVGWESAIREGGLSLVDVFPDAAYYLPSESWDGHSPTPASDIYALGVVLYRILTGKLPFNAATPLTLARQHQQKQPVRPSQFNTACSPELESITLQMLAKDPAQRQAPFDQLLSQGREELIAPPTSKKSSKSAPPQPDMPQAPPPKTTRKSSRQITRKELGKREFKGAFLALIWALIAIGLLGGIIYGAMMFWVQGAPPVVRVPDYVGMNHNNAKAILEERGLEMEVGREVYNPKRPTGTILSGHPRPETAVRAGRKIVVTISRGKEPIRMYDFRDLTLNQVKRITQKHGLRLGQISNRYSAVIPKNAIISQFPAPGQFFHRYDPINLVVSRGPQPSSSSNTNQEPNSPSDSGSFSPASEIPKQPANTPIDRQLDDLVSREVEINITMPEGTASQLVTIVINDATGIHTVYSEIHQEGDAIEQTVHVAKTASSQATVQVYAGGQLLREMRF